MATAGLGKISDYVSKFDGSRPEEFAGFLDSFQLGVRALEIKKSKQYAVLVNALATTGCWDVAAADAGNNAGVGDNVFGNTNIPHCVLQQLAR